MLNQVTIMGRLTRDPELRYTQSNTPVASFTVAVDRDYSKDSGSRETDFIDCVAWRSTAEFISKYFTKGSLAAITGRLQIRDWTDKEGNKRRNAEVIVENIYFGESKRRDSDSQTSYSASTTYGADSNDYSSQAAPIVNEFTQLNDDEGELPF